MIAAIHSDDAVGVEQWHQIGIDAIMWSSESPQTASTWPHAREVIDWDVTTAPDAETWKLVPENVMGLYGFDLNSWL